MPTGKLVPKYQRLIHNFFVNPFEFLKNTSDFLLLKFYEKFEIINPFEFAIPLFRAIDSPLFF